MFLSHFESRFFAMLSNNLRDNSQISPLFPLISCAIQKEILTLPSTRQAISLRISNITNLNITTIMSITHIALSLYATGALAQTQPVDGKVSTYCASRRYICPWTSDWYANLLRFIMASTSTLMFTNLNNLLPGSGFEGKTLEEIVEKAEGGIFNNAGQLLNHNLYFTQFAATTSRPANQ